MPRVELLAKLAAIVVHLDEGMGPQGRRIDWIELHALTQDPEVREWIAAMGALSPIKRE